MKIFNILICEIPIKYYIVCFVGTIFSYFYHFSSKNPIVQFLPYFNKKWAKHPIGKGIDALSFSILAAFIVTVVSDPTNARQAIIAGLGCMELLNSVIKGKNHE